MKAKPDKDEIIASNEKLEAECKSMAATLRSKGIAVRECPRCEDDDIIAHAENLNAYAKELLAMSVKPQVADKSAAEELTATEKCKRYRAGSYAIPTPPRYTGATAKCLAAKGKLN